jgi:hypothetical protein
VEYWDLIDAVNKRTGMPVVVNTSFNVAAADRVLAGTPITSSRWHRFLFLGSYHPEAHRVLV